MTLSTFLRFLVGRREAILDIASSPRAIWLGFLFVVSAGFAREYDGEDLLHEPWYLLIPLAASIVASLVLYILVRLVARLRSDAAQPFLAGYRSFLGLFWMTAPLAWLYAIPVERVLPPADAVAANLWLLGIVSLWRVALMTRVVSVLYACRTAAALFVVMLFADAVAMAVINLTPLPIFNLMGGIRLTQSEQLIQGTAFMIGFFGVVSLPLWFLGSLIVALSRKWRDGVSWHLRSPNSSPTRVSLGLWILAAAALLIWLPVLATTQPQQQNRRRVERLLRGGQIDAALDYMSARNREDFPPHWDPPPKIGYGEREPSLAELIDVIQRRGSAPWVLSLHIDKATFYGSHYAPWMTPVMDLTEHSDQQLTRFVTLLESLPEQGPELAATFREQIVGMVQPWNEDDRPEPPSGLRREAYDRLLKLAHDHDDKAASIDEMLSEAERLRNLETDPAAP